MDTNAHHDLGESHLSFLAHLFQKRINDRKLKGKTHLTWLNRDLKDDIILRSRQRRGSLCEAQTVEGAPESDVSVLQPGDWI